MDAPLARPLATRRALLRAGGCLIVSFSLAPEVRAAEDQTAFPLDQTDSFLAIDRAGIVTIHSGKVDLGTGARATYRMIVAEELDLDPATLQMVEGDTARTPNQGPTTGSNGVSTGGMQLRHAAATARAGLMRLAADRLGVPVEQLRMERGVINGGDKTIDFGALVGGGRFDLKLDPKAPTKDPARYRLIGGSIPRPDLPGKLTGAHVYVHDFKLPDMLHGRVIRPPALGARLLEVGEAPLPGVRVVRIGDFLGVVADDEWDAIRAARMLSARWSQPRELPGSDNIYEHVRSTPMVRTESLAEHGSGDPFAIAVRTVAASYEWPAQSHGSIGPSCAVADVTASAATIWTASQATHKYRDVFATFLGLPREQVRLIYLDGAGCYGMNGHDDAAADAALLSRAVGRPVRVQWSREDELGWDPKGPPQVIDRQAAIDASDNITGWKTTGLLPQNTKGLQAVPLLAPLAAGLDIADGQNAGQLQGNLEPPYEFARSSIAVRWLRDTPLRASNLRAPGKIANVFAVECFLDELAVATGADPLALRLELLPSSRGRQVLRTMANRLGWKPRLSPAVGQDSVVLRGRGIAYVHYKGADNHVATGIEVAVTRTTGAIVVERVVCAHDCGQIINLDGTLAQVEGSILQTLSRALFEEVTFDQGRVTSTDWASYRLLTFPDVPRIEIDLLDNPGGHPLGAGEAATTPVAAALGNAIFDATGVRMRRVPFSPERLKAGLAGLPA